MADDGSVPLLGPPSAESVEEGYRFFTEYSDVVHDHTVEALKSLDNWILTLSGGAIAFALSSAPTELKASAAGRNWLAVALALFGASVLLAMTAKGLAYVKSYSTYWLLCDEAECGYANLAHRVRAELKHKWHNRLVLAVNVLCFLAFCSGLTVAVASGVMMLHAGGPGESTTGPVVAAPGRGAGSQDRAPVSPSGPIPQCPAPAAATNGPAIPATATTAAKPAK